MKKYFIPYAYEMFGRVPVEAETFAEAVKKAREWLEKASVEEMAEYAEYTDCSEEIDDQGTARDEDGNWLDMSGVVVDG